MMLFDEDGLCCNDKVAERMGQIRDAFRHNIACMIDSGATVLELFTFVHMLVGGLHCDVTDAINKRAEDIAAQEPEESV